MTPSVVHLRASTYHHPRPLCGWYRGAFRLTHDLSQVTCLRCLKRVEVTAEVKRLWAKRVAESLDD